MAVPEATLDGALNVADAQPRRVRFGKDQGFRFLADLQCSLDRGGRQRFTVEITSDKRDALGLAGVNGPARKRNRAYRNRRGESRGRNPRNNCNSENKKSTQALTSSETD